MKPVTNIGARVDLLIRKGATFTKTVTLRLSGSAVDITGRTYTAQIRDRATGTLALSFTCALVTPLSGIFSFSLTAAQTDTLTAGTSYDWDLEQAYGSVVNHIFYGTVEVIEEVTA